MGCEQLTAWTLSVDSKMLCMKASLKTLQRDKQDISKSAKKGAGDRGGEEVLVGV